MWGEGDDGVGARIGVEDDPAEEWISYVEPGLDDQAGMDRVDPLDLSSRRENEKKE